MNVGVVVVFIFNLDVTSNVRPTVMEF